MAAKREQVFWKGVWPIVERLEKAFSLKAICSAGVLLFDKLSGDEQKQAIAEANEAKIIPTQKKALHNAIQIIKEMAEVEKQQPGTIYRVLAPAEQKIVDDFIKAVSPESQKQKKRKKA